MSSALDYVGMIVEAEEDGEWYGIKGMKWGVTRSKAQLRAAKKGGEGPDPTKPPKGPETSAQRYARLGAAARQGKANALSDEDLKWFNTRTEALSKINKLNANNPSWLKKTADEVLKNTAKKTLQSVSDATAAKYIGDPLVRAIKATPDKKSDTSGDSKKDTDSVPDAVKNRVEKEKAAVKKKVIRKIEGSNDKPLVKKKILPKFKDKK